MINPILSTGSAVDHCQQGEDSHLQYVTLRDYFAGCALTGLVVGEKDFTMTYEEYAYKIADAMLVERAKAKP
jgi:hypothetical protein